MPAIRNTPLPFTFLSLLACSEQSLSLPVVYLFLCWRGCTRSLPVCSYLFARDRTAQYALHHTLKGVIVVVEQGHVAGFSSIRQMPITSKLIRLRVLLLLLLVSLLSSLSLPLSYSFIPFSSLLFQSPLLFLPFSLL